MAQAIRADVTFSVSIEDEMKRAIDAAKARAAIVYAKVTPTLVDMIPLEEWQDWDASSEEVTLADCDGLDDVDLIDQDDMVPRSCNAA